MPQDFIKGTPMLVPQVQWDDTRARRIRELTEQRDELLAALKKIAYAQFSLESPPIKSAAEILRGFAIEAIAKAEKK